MDDDIDVHVTVMERWEVLLRVHIVHLLKGYSLSHDRVALDIWQRC